jgi:hypothetical protein
MQINFIQEHGTIFCVALNEIYQGRIHEELLYGEISPMHGKHWIRFESDWRHPVVKDTLEEAKQYVCDNHYKFNPHSNKSNYEIHEE